MARVLKTYHPNFIKYQKFIIGHQNYKDFPEAVDATGSIKWVTAGKSELGKKRERWWLEKGAELKSKGIKVADHARLSPIALANHPTKIKACQTCGRELSLEYVYLVKNSIKSINKASALIDKLDENGIVNVFELAYELFEKIGIKTFAILDLAFPGCRNMSTLPELNAYIQTNFVDAFSKRLGPGAMSNCPDRLDGFHSYNRCCRGEEDTGRHTSNLARYGEDRRAYENWADGDWKAASWLMKVYSQHDVSADHIGPISLGFCHRPYFQPMTEQENSSKGNRLTYADCLKLKQHEDEGEQVVSWHSAPLWNRLKVAIKNDADALEASKYMRRNMHYILTIMANLKEIGLNQFLESFLNPDYAYYSIEFIGFDPITGSYQEMKKIRGDITQYSRNAERYKKIAFLQLDEYLIKDNRKVAELEPKILNNILEKISTAYHQAGNDLAKKVLLDELDSLALTSYKEFIAGITLQEPD